MTLAVASSSHLRLQRRPTLSLPIVSVLLRLPLYSGVLLLMLPPSAYVPLPSLLSILRVFGLALSDAASQRLRVPAGLSAGYLPFGAIPAVRSLPLTLASR